MLTSELKKKKKRVLKNHALSHFKNSELWKRSLFPFPFQGPHSVRELSVPIDTTAELS